MSQGSVPEIVNRSFDMTLLLMPHLLLIYIHDYYHSFTRHRIALHSNTPFRPSFVLLEPMTMMVDL